MNWEEAQKDETTLKSFSKETERLIIEQQVTNRFLASRHIGHALTIKTCRLLRLSIVRIPPRITNQPKAVTLGGA